MPIGEEVKHQIIKKHIMYVNMNMYIYIYIYLGNL